MVKQTSESQPDRTLRLLAVCGVIVPILYTIVVIILGALRPGYCHRAQLLSELGEAGAPNAIIMNTAGFSLLGALMIAFAFGLNRGISEGKGSKVDPALLAVHGAGYVAVGFFPCDPGCLAVSFTGVMHVWASFIIGISFILALFLIARRFKNDRRWENYRLYTWATSVVMMNLIMFEGWTGALQRIFVGASLLWTEVMAVKLLRLSIWLGARS